MSSPTQLTLAKLREEGWTAFVVEHWNQYARRRIDLGGGIDVLAWKGPRWLGEIKQLGGVLGVQTTSATHHADHKAKLLLLPAMREWVASGSLLQLWSWSTRRSLERTKAGKRSKRLVHHLRREEIRLSDFVPQQAFSEAARAQEEQPREAMT